MTLILIYIIDHFSRYAKYFIQLGKSSKNFVTTHKKQTLIGRMSSVMIMEQQFDFKRQVL